MEVVSASHGALGPLLGKLTALLADECGRLKGVRREIRSLRSELTCMHAALKEYTKLQDPKEQVKAWISLVRELAYDIEDCFDKFVHQLGNDNDRGHDGFKEFFRQTARRLKTLGSRRGIAGQIDDLKSRIKQVKELKDSYKLDETPDGTTRHAAVDPRLHALFAEEAHLVGIDGPRDDLAKWMMDEENNSSKHRKVLSIVGFGGLGKTTLANEVYRKIQGNFHCKALVSVSQKPDIKKIIKDIISQVLCQDGFIKDTDNWDEYKYITKLREVLQDKRYLVIIDDLWSTSAWGAIHCAFPKNNCSSRIIVTTRIVEVAKSCCPGSDDRVYEMQALSDLHSRRLFLKRIFGSEDYCPEMMKEVSNKILKKCGGLPLAISSISSLLANKPIVKEVWEKVKRSIGSALEKNQSLEGMSSILSLSYNDLPSHLKTCLLYLSMFPEDYLINRKRLVRLWIAEGFISEDREQSQQEVAEQCFYELINKSMIQPVDIDCDGEVHHCRIHDMMLELIISKSGEDNFITVVGGGETVLAICRGLFIRRLSVQHIDQEVASVLASEDLSHVRTLTVTSSDCIKHLPCLAEFKALRVLDYEDCRGLEEYSINGLDKLFQLKYLGLNGMGISKLPPGIVKLHDLETLDLRGTSVEDLPSGIVRLIKLQNVLTRGGCKVPDGIGIMRNLQVLQGFDIVKSSVGAIEELGNLTCLKELNIRMDSGRSDKYKRHEDMLHSSLCKLGSCKLQSLVIGGSKSFIDFLGSWSPLPSSLQIFVTYGVKYYFRDFPKWIVPALTSLAYLDIVLAKLSDSILLTIGELPALITLDLWLETRPKEKLTVQGIGFPTLKRFNVFRTALYITFAKGAMPKLEILSVPFYAPMAKNHGFHLGIEHLRSLKRATVRIGKGDATPSDIMAAAVAIRNEVDTHPNHPTHTISNQGFGCRTKKITGGTDKSGYHGNRWLPDKFRTKFSNNF